MKVLMIGAGDIAKSHARAVEKLGGEIVGAFDVSENALKSFKKEFYECIAESSSGNHYSDSECKYAY